MEIQVLSRNKDRKSIYESTAYFYAKLLNITKSNYKVYICFDKDMAKNDSMNGVCAKTGEREITIAIDSKLEPLKMFRTLAHEMVHVKQMVRGQYRAEVLRNGRTAHYWLGKRIKADYYDRPWEREAFMREGVLSMELSRMVEQGEKKVKKSV